MEYPSSSDLRKRYLAARDEGMSASAAGLSIRVLRSTAVRLVSMWQLEQCAEVMPRDRELRLQTRVSYLLKASGCLEF